MAGSASAPRRVKRVERIFASTYEENAGSRNVMVKLGMRFVRAFRPSDEDLHLTLGIGDYTDRFPKPDVEYALTRAEWSEDRARRLQSTADARLDAN